MSNSIPANSGLKSLRAGPVSPRERIRQIEAKPLRKMRHPIRIRKLEGFIELPGA